MFLMGVQLNKFAFMAIAGLLSTSTAFAADLGIVQQPAPTAFTSAYDWSGFYAGANLGYGWAEIEQGGFAFDDINGVFGGVQAGYNYDFGGFVLGVEGDVQLSDIKYSEDLGGGVTGELGIDFFGTVRARAGLAVDRFMPYVTGGVAWARGSISVSGGGGSVEFTDNYLGWTVGGGLEYAVTDNVTVKGEYLYTDFGAADFDTGVDVNLTSHVVRAGVNFKF